MLPDFTVFDFETTGTDYRTDQVVEMAAVRVIAGHSVATFSTLVRLRPAQVYHPDAQAKTKLTPEILQHGMKEANAFQQLYEFTKGTVLVAHNILFDYAFLHHGLRRAGYEEPTHPFLCTLTVGRNRQPRPHNLKAMCQAYGVELRPAHRAMNDVLMTLDLFMAMMAEGKLDHYENRAGWDGRFEHPTWYPNHATLVKQKTKAAPKVEPQTKLSL